MGKGKFFLGLKRPGRETDHYSPTAKVKKLWSYISTSHMFSSFGELTRYLDSFVMSVLGSRKQTGKLLLYIYVLIYIIYVMKFCAVSLQ
jgi:hypothetical protein